MFVEAAPILRSEKNLFYRVSVPQKMTMGLICSGPGVGKGRQIAGMIAENHFRKSNNRDKALWISVSADLIFDARRDLKDLGLHSEIPCFDLKVHILSRAALSHPAGMQHLACLTALAWVEYVRVRFSWQDYNIATDLTSERNIVHGVFFCTYSLLIRETEGKAHPDGPDVGGPSTIKEDAKAKAKVRRLDQIVNWCGGQNFNGIIALDECHRAKHMQQTKDKDGVVSIKEGAVIQPRSAQDGHRWERKKFNSLQDPFD